MSFPSRNLSTSQHHYKPMGKKNQANTHKFLLKLRPVSRTAQKAELSIPKAVI